MELNYKAVQRHFEARYKASQCMPIENHIGRTHPGKAAVKAAKRAKVKARKETACLPKN